MIAAAGTAGTTPAPSPCSPPPPPPWHRQHPHVLRPGFWFAFDESRPLAALDPLLAPGARKYWKSHDFVELSDAAIEVILAAAAALPDPQTEIAMAHLGGAMARVANDATAFPQRAAHFTMNLHTR